MLIQRQPQPQMGRTVRRARKQQRKALRQVKRHQRMTNKQYRQNTRTERGQDFASTNNATFGQAISGLISKAGDIGAFFATGGASSATAMAGFAPVPVRTMRASAAVEVTDDTTAPELPTALTGQRPRWVMPVAVGGGVLLLGAVAVAVTNSKRSKK